MLGGLRLEAGLSSGCHSKQYKIAKASTSTSEATCTVTARTMFGSCRNGVLLYVSFSQSRLEVVPKKNVRDYALQQFLSDVLGDGCTSGGKSAHDM